MNWKRQSEALDMLSLILSCSCSCPSMTSRVKTGALATIASLSTFSFSFSDRYFFPNVANEAAAVLLLSRFQFGAVGFCH